MMVAKITFTTDEIEAFFKANKFTVVPHTRGRWVSAYHNRAEWVEIQVPGIVVNDRVVDAEQVFNKIIEYRLKKTIAPANLETERMITLIAKKL